MLYFNLFLFSFPLVLAAPTSLDASTLLKNGQDAQSLNVQFKDLKSTDPCTSGQTACISGDLAQCVSNAWNTTQCAPSQQCFALPSVRDRGTSVSCTSEASAQSLIHATGATGGTSSAGNTTVPFPTSDGSPNSNSNSSSTTGGTNTVTVTVTLGNVMTLPSETRTLSPAEASGLLASLANGGSLGAISTVLPPATTTTSCTSSWASSSASGVVAAATTIFLNGPAVSSSSSSSSPTAAAPAATSDSSGYGY